MLEPLSLGFSPCPNDTFIFYAIVNGKLKNSANRYRETVADVETLNRMAAGKTLDVTKISYHAFGHLLNDYVLLRSGSALGRGCGPLLIALPGIGPKALTRRKVAIPGRLTTAALLLRLHGEYENLIEMSFEKIIPAITSGEVDGGVIIHESRFTYQKEGLTKIVDLGSWWEEITGLPVPLGGIIARRDFSPEDLLVIDRDIRNSVEYALTHVESPFEYVRGYSQEMEPEILKQHIDLYVNSFSVDLGREGIDAVDCLLKMGYDKGIFSFYRDDFVIRS